MSDEGKLIQQQNTGAAAEKALEILAGAFDEAIKRYTEAWLGSEVRDSAGREKLWVATTVASKVQDHLRKQVIDGRFAARQLDEIRKAGEPKRRFGLPI